MMTVSGDWVLLAVDWMGLAGRDAIFDDDISKWERKVSREKRRKYKR